MTDTHREAFELHHGLRYDEIDKLKISDGSKMRLKLDWERTFETWCAALRYRDEQDWSGTLSCAGCGEPVDDPHTFDCPMAERDEQEKQA